jgi:uncharacterized protein YecE (DUF72 family)
MSKVLPISRLSTEEFAGGAITELRRIRVGIAGWSNPPAFRADRPSKMTHLEFYAEQFSCVEINSSFHRPHRPTTYARWRDETPAAFRFAVKMPRSITHESCLRQCRADVTRFYKEVEHLQPKLGAILVQMPPSLEFNAITVRSFFKALPRWPGVTVACEPRHPSWFAVGAEKMLQRLAVARVAADPGRYPGAQAPGGSCLHAYFRWHGSPRMYYSQYSDAQLAVFATQVKTSAAQHAWCIFDNTANYAAWHDARRFITLLHSRSKT